MEKRVGLIAVFVLVASSAIFVQVRAQINDFTFFVPYPADLLDDQFDAAQSANFISVDIVTTISIAVQRDGSIIYYDHWEDGLEAEITSPTQPSTQVWGDGNPANGAPPNIPSDVLVARDVIAPQNVVPVPRNPADFYFDGGDKIVSLGGPIAVTLAVWPDDPGSGILFAGAWELYPTSRWDTSYVIPVGQNVPRPNGSFATVGLNVQAVEDGTSVQLDLNADGTFENTIVLDHGKQFTQVLGVMAGAQVLASDPVQVHILTGDPDSTYEARAYTMLPRSQWADDYLAPRSSDGDFWLYNPDPADLEVLVQTVTGTTTVIIPANGTARYPPLPDPVLSSPTGVRFTSTDGRPFYGLAALDETDDQDWGYALLPTYNLTTQALIGWAPGNNNVPPDGDESRVYVTAVTTTTVFVDYDKDGTIDASFPVPALAEVPITDPNDHDMTGALYTAGDNSVPFMAVWGQDQGAPPALPSIDVGTNIVPLPSLSIQKTYTPIENKDGCGPVNWGDTIRFELRAYNNSINPIFNAVVEDQLPETVTYVPGSTIRGGSPIPDDSSGTPFPLDEGGYGVGTVDPLGTVFFTYEAKINEGAEQVENWAQIVSPGVTTPDPSGAEVRIHETILDIETTLIDPLDGRLNQVGQAITFSQIITNTGVVTIAVLPLQDTFDETHFTFRNASLPPDITASGVITWNNLTLFGVDLVPGDSISLLVSFVLDQIPSVLTSTFKSLIEVPRSSDGERLQCGTGEAVVYFATPTSTATSTSTSTATTTATTTGTPVTVTSTATATPTGTPPITVTATPAVTFLPETGVSHPTMIPVGFLAALPVLGLLVAWMAHRRRE